MFLQAILNVRGLDMDLYSPEFFKGEDGGKDPINPFEYFKEGKIYGYGQLWDSFRKDYTEQGCIDLTAYLEEVQGDLVLDPTYGIRASLDPVAAIINSLTEVPEADLKRFLITKPPVPPRKWFVKPGELEVHHALMGWWLGYYNNNVPKFYSETSSSKDLEITVEESGDVSFYPLNAEANPAHTLFFLNGIACMPTINGLGVRIPDGASYFKNHKDRDRSWVGIDFKPVGGATFYRLNTLNGSLKEFMLPCDFGSDSVSSPPKMRPGSFDAKKHSVLLVLDGRLMLPDEYTLATTDTFVDVTAVDGTVSKVRYTESRISINTLKAWKPVYNLDQKVCKNEFVYGMRDVISDDVDIWNSPNSFIIVVNTPHLQIIKHEPTFSSHRPRKWHHGSPAMSQIMKNQYDVYARGLMFDLSTKSATEYMREVHTQTFYAGSGQELNSWSASTTTIRPQMPIVILSQNSDNLMSARGTVFDLNKRYDNDTVVWPRFVILDFIFRG